MKKISAVEVFRANVLKPQEFRASLEELFPSNRGTSVEKYTALRNSQDL